MGLLLRKGMDSEEEDDNDDYHNNKDMNNVILPDTELKRERLSYFSDLHVVTGELCIDLMRGQQVWDGLIKDSVQGSHS